MRRIAAVVAAVTVAALAPLAAARPAAEGDVAVATGFVRLLVTGDPAACSRMSASYLASLRAASLDCAAWVSSFARTQDFTVRRTLQDVEESASEISIRWNAEWLPRRGAVDALVRELRAAGERVRAGVGPGAARTAAAGLVVVDRRTTPSRLVLHARGPSGRVWTLVEAPGASARITPSAVRGAPLVDPVGPGAAIVAERPGHTTVLTPIVPADGSAVVTGVDADGKIDTVLLGSQPAALVATEPLDVAVATADLTAAWTARDFGPLCAMTDGPIREAMAEDCADANEFAGATVEVKVPQDAPVGSGAALFEISFAADGVRISLHNMVARVGGRTRIVALFLDPVQLVAATDALEKLPL